MQSAIKIPGKKYYFLYSFLLLVMAVYCYKRPSYNWDMLAYMALAAGADNKGSFKDVHAKVYAEAQKYVPAESYDMLVQSNHPLRSRLYTDADYFREKLPFFVVKPLYIGVVYIFFKAGFNLVAATVLPSMFAFFIMGLLLFHWMGRYFNEVWAMACSVAFMYSAPFVTTAKLSTPDCFAALFLFTAVYFIVERKQIQPAYIFLLLSVCARIDNVLPSVIFLSWLYWRKALSIKHYWMMMSGIAICYWGIAWLAHGYGWSMYFYDSFSSNYDWYEKGAGNFLAGYLASLKSAVLVGLQFSHVVIFLFMAVLALVIKNNTAHDTEIKQLMICLLLIFLIRLLLNPLVADRFYIAYYLLIAVLLVKKMANSVNGTKQPV